MKRDSHLGAMYMTHFIVLPYLLFYLARIFSQSFKLSFSPSSLSFFPYSFLYDLLFSVFAEETPNMLLTSHFNYDIS